MNFYWLFGCFFVMLSLKKLKAMQLLSYKFFYKGKVFFMVSLSLFFMQTLSFMSRLKDIFNFLKTVAPPWVDLVSKIGKHAGSLWDVIKAVCVILKI